MIIIVISFLPQLPSRKGVTQTPIALWRHINTQTQRPWYLYCIYSHLFLKGLYRNIVYIVFSVSQFSLEQLWYLLSGQAEWKIPQLRAKTSDVPSVMYCTKSTNVLLHVPLFGWAFWMWYKYVVVVLLLWSLVIINCNDFIELESM